MSGCPPSIENVNKHTQKNKTKKKVIYLFIYLFIHLFISKFLELFFDVTKIHTWTRETGVHKLVK